MKSPIFGENSPTSCLAPWKGRAWSSNLQEKLLKHGLKTIRDRKKPLWSSKNPKPPKTLKTQETHLLIPCPREDGGGSSSSYDAPLVLLFHSMALIKIKPTKTFFSKLGFSSLQERKRDEWEWGRVKGRCVLWLEESPQPLYTCALTKN